MSVQQTLDGFGFAPERVFNVFFALMPDDLAAAQAQTLAMAIGADQGKAIKPDRRARFHVTLFHVGDFANEVPPSVMQAARHAAEQVHASPFDVESNRLGSFSGRPGRIPVVLHCAQSQPLMALQADMSERMRNAGLSLGNRHPVYRPHLTLFYGKVPVAEQTVPPIRWTAQDFVLIRSIVGHSTYLEEGRWPLLGQVAPHASP